MLGTSVEGVSYHSNFLLNKTTCRPKPLLHIISSKCKQLNKSLKRIDERVSLYRLAQPINIYLHV